MASIRELELEEARRAEAAAANGNGKHEEPSNRGVAVLQRQWEEKEAEKAWEWKLAGLAYQIRKQDPERDVEGMKEDLASYDLPPPVHLNQEDIAGTIAWIADGVFKQVPMLAPKPDEPVLPTVFVRNKIEILTWEQLRERRQAHVQNWAVQGWLALGEISMWSGKVEHGKTTLMRELTLCKVRGEPFLGHDCPQGRVFYAMLDADGENLTYDEFEKMGMNDGDREHVRFLFEPMLARMEKGPEQFFSELWAWKPDIVIIDPFARLQEIGDFNDYNNTYLMAMLSQYAKTINAHFALPGHIPRGRPAGSTAATAAFGSIAFGGGVNARFVVERKEGTDIHVLRTSKGKSAGFEAFEGDQVLERDAMGRISLGKPFSFGQQAGALKPRVLDLITEAPPQDWTPAAVAKELGATTGLIRVALGMLFDDQKLERTGSGKKGNPYLYSKRIGPKMPDVGNSENQWFRD